MLKQWVRKARAEGDAKQPPPLPKFPDGWQLGKPDLVVTMPKAYTVPAEGRDVYRNFVIPMKVPEGKYIRTVEFRPGNRRVVHHAIIVVRRDAESCVSRDGKDGEPGFTQSNFPGQIFPGSMGFWVPGKEARPLPERRRHALAQGRPHLAAPPAPQRQAGARSVNRRLLFHRSSAPQPLAVRLRDQQQRKLDIPAGGKDLPHQGRPRRSPPTWRCTASFRTCT